MTFIEEIAAKLQTAGVGTVATDIFIGDQPPSPDNLVLLVETSGQEPNKEIPITKPTFQVIIRNSSYGAGRAKATSAFNALHQLANADLGDNYVFYVLATSDVGYIGRDENNRHEWSINFRAERRAG